MYINERTANMYNNAIANHIGERIDGRLVKIRWNNKLGMSEAIYEAMVDKKLVYIVDTVTKDKRDMYLHMCHATPKTLQAAMDRTNGSFQLSLASCFGYVSPVWEIRAIIIPYKEIFGITGVNIAETYENKR